MRNFLKNIQQRTNQKGVTLIELLMYMALLTILVTLISGIFASVLDSQLEAEASSAVDQDGRYLMAKLTRDMQSASAITQPAAGQQGSTLQITVNSINYTYTSNGSGNLQLTNNNGTDNLNSFGTSVSNLNFQRIGSGGTNDTIRVSFTVTSRTKRSSGPQNETRNFETTLGLQ